ncbi:MAG: LysR family transcriptional regulator [Thermosynechococcaceae cyanobacterium MS004]|nr:LysR family transcriptional regulator [Thermosynechococcaceae cyanobacterium MS004]
MNISHLKTLLAVAEQGSFSQAALSLGVSQSAVSRAIASLEEELGVSLLARGRFGAYLTNVGERMVPHAMSLLKAYAQIEAESNREKNLYGGRVRIASFRSVATHILPERIAEFSARFPQVEVSLVEADPTAVEQALRENRVDIGLVPLPRTSDDFETWEILQDEFVVLLPPGKQKAPAMLTWKDLGRYAFILYNYAECTSVVRQHWHQSGQSLKVAYEIKEDSTIVNMVAKGLGAAVLPKLAAMPIPEGVQVRSLPVPLMRCIGAAVLTNLWHSPAVFTFLDLLRGTGIFSENQH